ncbi:Mbeg1-like protein [Fictibacillus sp. Mic-4]|uniref:lipase family protein n=1 Tax=Fictibacillus sp. Mic-4 TaxID=3132826 RepID=UPI003CFAB010
MSRPDETYSISSDKGKLILAGDMIYNFDDKNSPKHIDKRTLEDNMNAKIIDQYVDPKSGFSGYALKDNETGEIVIAYVGTQPQQKGKGDIIADAEIGGYNLFGLNFLSTTQADQADSFYQKVKANANGAKISITGHSLGGGLANTVAMRNKQDHIDVLSLNPAPLLNLDVVRYGYGFDQKNIRNVINENDPLHLGVKDGDMVIPGQMYKIPNGKGHSYAFDDSDFSKDGSLVWFDKLKSDNDTGLDFFPGFFELVSSAGDVYKGITEKNFGTKEAIKFAGGMAAFPGLSASVSVIVAGLMNIADMSALGLAFETLAYPVVQETILFCEQLIGSIKTGVSNAVLWIEDTLVKMKEKIDAALEKAFDIAFDAFKVGVSIYLTASEIMGIVKDVAFSYFKEIMDVFKGDFDIDPHIEQIVVEHLVSHYQTLKTLFLQDPTKGINKNLVNEIKNDIDKLSKEIVQLSDDVKSAVQSMVEKDEELKSTLFVSLAG